MANPNIKYIVIAVALIIIIIVMPLTYIIYNDNVNSRSSIEYAISNYVTAPINISPVLKEEPLLYNSSVLTLNSPTIEQCPIFSRFINANIRGNNIKNAPIKNISEEQCQKSCQDNNCDWYNYDQKKQTCWLKQGTARNRYITAFRVNDKPPNSICPAYYKLQNLDVNGNVTDYIKNISEDACQKACTEKQCQWYNYNKNTRECWLKNTKPSNGIISGFKTMPDN